MARKSQNYSVEMLEHQRLLSQPRALSPIEVSLLAPDHRSTVSVVGTIAGEFSFKRTPPPSVDFSGSGSLPILGLVQMEAVLPMSDNGRTEDGTMTLNTNAGTLILRVDVAGNHPLKLTVLEGTGAYTGWKGSGTMSETNQPGYYREFIPDRNAFKLKLTT
jgi:hypothetical protein